MHLQQLLKECKLKITTASYKLYNQFGLLHLIFAWRRPEFVFNHFFKNFSPSLKLTLFFE